MRLFFQDTPPDPKEIHEYVSKGFGIEHPEWVLGYMGTWLFTLMDVYVTEKVDETLMSRPSFSDTLQSLLKRFKEDDYGNVTKSEESNNVENRYCSGGPAWMIGRYDTELGVVVFENFYDISLLYFEGEDISDTRKQQDIRLQEVIRANERAPWWIKE